MIAKVHRLVSNAVGPSKSFSVQINYGALITRLRHPRTFHVVSTQREENTMEKNHYGKANHKLWDEGWQKMTVACMETT